MKERVSQLSKLSRRVATMGTANLFSTWLIKRSFNASLFGHPHYPSCSLSTTSCFPQCRVYKY